MLQLTRAHDLNLDQATYLEIIRAKTAELFAAAAEAGAVSAGVADAQIAALRDYGVSLGLAFQLADDALDYAGAAETLGKNAGDDFREGKATLPLLLAIARSGPREAAFWERAIGRHEQTEADFRRARELIIGAGALEATLDLAADYAEAAKAALAIFPASDWRDRARRPGRLRGEPPGLTGALGRRRLDDLRRPKGDVLRSEEGQAEPGDRAHGQRHDQRLAQRRHERQRCRHRRRSWPPPRRPAPSDRSPPVAMVHGGWVGGR